MTEIHVCPCPYPTEASTSAFSWMPVSMQKKQNVPLFNSRDNAALRALSINQLSIPGQNLTILPDMWPTPLVVHHKNSHLKSSNAQ